LLAKWEVDLFCEVGMKPERSPRYVVLIRWGTFRLELVGRTQITIAATVVAALLGARFYFF
jgi:hypothetical protein